MEPVPAALLAALAGGAGTAAGQQAWEALRALVLRPFRRGASGADAVTALAEAPGDGARAERLAAALAARAAQDPEFAQAMRAWLRVAEGAADGPSEARNTVSGGTQSAVVQARDIHGGVSFRLPPEPPRSA
ncbi:hypothetical protein SAMN05216267_1003155 [Actinacidiphila rubida]|uniref:Uncharacterized protein n=1 Tax=Actinacidiphila rubida TaxID=310780 RepID=A0A1H8F6A6_9ACTN|nr:hypothetical protein [Actinacidiphila rubida]SEN27259.1 hypothetical protein SAMN05216267_1003155 [Actinacidiphila rubida]